MKISGKNHHLGALWLLLLPTALCSSQVGDDHGPLRSQVADEQQVESSEKGRSNHGSRRSLGNQQSIIGGSTTTGSAYPFHALLFEDANDDTSYGCGGTLIAADRVLTAAHCFDEGTTYSYVRIGGTNNNDGEKIAISNFILHPDWDETSSDDAYDLAVIELATCSTCSSTVTLNQDSGFPSTAGTALKLIGFGQTDASDSSSASTVLKEVDLNFVTTSDCQAEFPFVTADIHVCTDGVSASEGSCSGDSGGPLLFENTIQVGVNSFSRDPCATGGFDVFANIAPNYDFINENAFATSCAATRLYKRMIHTLTTSWKSP